MIEEAFVEGSDVGHVLFFGQVESDIKHESTKLSVELNSEEGYVKIIICRLDLFYL